MTDTNKLLPVERFLHTLIIVEKEGRHLSFSYGRLFDCKIDETWVNDLEREPELAEKLEAFVSRFGRMQDTIADKLLPRWLQAQAENPGSQIEVLNRAERLNVLASVENWLVARKLRNRLVHEYMESAELFAEDLKLAKELSKILIQTYNSIRHFALTRMGLVSDKLPPSLAELI